MSKVRDFLQKLNIIKEEETKGISICDREEEKYLLKDLEFYKYSKRGEKELNVSAFVYNKDYSKMKDVVSGKVYKLMSLADNVSKNNIYNYLYGTCSNVEAVNVSLIVDIARRYTGNMSDDQIVVTKGQVSNIARELAYNYQRASIDSQGHKAGNQDFKEISENSRDF